MANKGEAIQVLSTTSFTGGMTVNSKTALANSCRFSQNLDIFTDKDSVKLNPKAILDSAATVVDLVQWGVSAQPYSSDLYFYGNTGKIYKRSAGAWSVDRSVGVGAAAGQGLAVFFDGLYYATSTTLGRKYQLDNSPAYNDDFLSDGTLNLGVSASSLLPSGSTYNQTYTLPTSISEGATNTFSFAIGTASQLISDPIKEIDVSLVSKGTGNWTLTVHDYFNNVVGSATVSNGSLVSGTAYQPFVFSTPLRITIGAAYHFHLTSSVADGTVQTYTASDLSTAQINQYFGILIGSAPFHPMMPYGNILGAPGLVIGNGNYLATFTPFSYQPNLITLDPGFFVRSLIYDHGYVVALADRGTDVNSYQEGKLYYWDGSTPNYNFSVPLVTGVPNAGQSFKSRPFMVCGNRGDLYIANTTDVNRKIQPLPQLGYGQTLEVKPGAMDVWGNIMQIGYGASGTDPNFTAGVYSFGSQSDRAVDWQEAATEVLNLGYTISTGNASSDQVQIGSVLAVGQDMYIGWSDSTSGSTVYGVDRVNKGGNVAAAGTWQSLIEDRGVDKTGQMAHMPQKNKHALSLIVTFESLPASCSVSALYKINRATSFTVGMTLTTTGADHLILPLNADYREIEYGFQLTGHNTDTPVVTGVYLTSDLLVDESMENFS